MEDTGNGVNSEDRVSAREFLVILVPLRVSHWVLLGDPGSGGWARPVFDPQNFKLGVGGGGWGVGE